PGAARPASAPGPWRARSWQSRCSRGKPSDLSGMLSGTLPEEERLAGTDRTIVATQAQLAELVYELLDAHVDTMRLVEDPEAHPGWDAHLDYLRDLQRVGRQVLAGVG